MKLAMVCCLIYGSIDKWLNCYNNIAFCFLLSAFARKGAKTQR
jgi:hypothetical protein